MPIAPLCSPGFKPDAALLLWLLCSPRISTSVCMAALVVPPFLSGGMAETRDCDTDPEDVLYSYRVDCLRGASLQSLGR
jgi:hypothetical protein